MAYLHTNYFHNYMLGLRFTKIGPIPESLSLPEFNNQIQLNLDVLHLSTDVFLVFIMKTVKIIYL